MAVDLSLKTVTTSEVKSTTTPPPSPAPEPKIEKKESPPPAPSTPTPDQKAVEQQLDGLANAGKAQVLLNNQTTTVTTTDNTATTPAKATETKPPEQQNQVVPEAVAPSTPTATPATTTGTTPAPASNQPVNPLVKSETAKVSGLPSQTEVAVSQELITSGVTDKAKQQAAQLNGQLGLPTTPNAETLGGVDMVFNVADVQAAQQKADPNAAAAEAAKKTAQATQPPPNLPGGLADAIPDRNPRYFYVVDSAYQKPDGTLDERSHGLAVVQSAAQNLNPQDKIVFYNTTRNAVGEPGKPLPNSMSLTNVAAGVEAASTLKDAGLNIQTVNMSLGVGVKAQDISDAIGQPVTRENYEQLAGDIRQAATATPGGLTDTITGMEKAESKGMQVFLAAGNDGQGTANLLNVAKGVTAVGNNDAYSSDLGKDVNFSGNLVLPDANGVNRVVTRGTSISTPLVGGILQNLAKSDWSSFSGNLSQMGIQDLTSLMQARDLEQNKDIMPDTSTFKGRIADIMMKSRMFQIANNGPDFLG